MPYATTDDGIKLYYEQSGEGDTLVFVHEFAGDYRSWEPQIRFFSRRYHCIVFNARGYPPSDVPDDGGLYSQDRARLDILSVINHCGVAKAHICGLSMGGFATLHFGLHHADRALSLVVAGCGYGAEKEKQDQFRVEAETSAAFIEESSSDEFAKHYSEGPTRVQFMNKDPRGWAEFRSQLAEHSAQGSVLTMRGVQAQRPSLFDLEQKLSELCVPTLILTGDEDEPCLVPGIFMKRLIRSSALVMLANSGHTINLEEPDAFNNTVDQFLIQVKSGRWPVRETAPDPGGSILGMNSASG